MAKRWMLLTALVIGVSLAGCAELPSGLVPPTPSGAGEAIQGQAVGQETPELTQIPGLTTRYVIRLFADQQMTQLRYEIEVKDGKYTVFSGSQAVLQLVGQTVYSGADTADEVLYTIEDDYVHAGETTSGPVVYTISKGQVYQGGNTDQAIYTITGKRMVSGSNSTGDLVFQGDRSLTGKVQFLLPILAQ